VGIYKTKPSEVTTASTTPIRQSYNGMPREHRAKASSINSLGIMRPASEAQTA